MAVDSNSNVVECEFAERDQGLCLCGGGPSLGILDDVRRAYEERMELLSRDGGTQKLQMQVSLLRAWVRDLAAQNALLARAVTELEQAATARLLLERRRHDEMMCELRAEAAALRACLARKDSDLRGLIEVLRRLREFDYYTIDGINFHEVTEIDIFGSELWTRKNLDHGDHERKNLDHGDHERHIGDEKNNRFFK